MKKIIATLMMLVVALVGSLALASSASATNPTQSLDCDVLRVDYKHPLTNGDHVNMTIKDSTGEYQVNVYVDRNLGGYDDLGLRYSNGTTEPLTEAQVKSGQLTFNYGTMVKARPYTVKFVQTNSTDTFPNKECGTTTPPTDPPGDNKKVEICHYNGGSKTYSRVEVNVNGWLNGHKAHSEDIWAAFTYTTRGGDEVSVPAQGNTALLAFATCVEPKVDTPIAKPEPTIVDKCGTSQDNFSVPAGANYTVGTRTGTYPNWSITATANEGFVFVGGSKTATFTSSAADFPNNADCDLPETGGMQTAGTAGAGALGALVLAGLAYVLIGRRKTA